MFYFSHVFFSFLDLLASHYPSFHLETLFLYMVFKMACGIAKCAKSTLWINLFFWLDVIEDLMRVKKKKVAFNFQWKILFLKNNIRNLVCNGSCTFMYTFLESIFRLLATNSCKHFFYSCICEKKVLLRFFGLNIFFRNNKVHKFYFYPYSCGQMFWI
jgi:hypothetical protein